MKAIFEKKHVDREDVRSREYIIELAKSLDIYSENFENDIDSKDSLNYISDLIQKLKRKEFLGLLQLSLKMVILFSLRRLLLPKVIQYSFLML